MKDSTTPRASATLSCSKDFRPCAASAPINPCTDSSNAMSCSSVDRVRGPLSRAGRVKGSLTRGGERWLDGRGADAGPLEGESVVALGDHVGDLGPVGRGTTDVHQALAR